jgi:hypothetical protein
MNQWLYEDKVYEPPEEMDPKVIYGFVYLIENLKNGRKYIGKKLFWSMRTRQVKGKKKKYKAESDWKKYHGSSGELTEDLEKFGKENFKRTILHLCKSKSECSYMELKEQIERDAILRQDYYNAWIQVRIRKAHLRHIHIDC